MRKPPFELTPVTEDEKAISTKVPDEVWRWLRHITVDWGTNLRSLCRETVIQFYNQHKEDKTYKFEISPPTEEERAISTRAPDEVWRGLSHLSIDWNTSTSGICREAIIQFYNEHKKKQS